MSGRPAVRNEAEPVGADEGSTRGASCCASPGPRTSRILPAFTDSELREAGILPAFDREQLLASLREPPELAEQGRLLALAAAEAESGEIIGGGTLHHLDAERRIVEIGYFVLPAARGRGVATTIARMLAEHAFHSASSGSPHTRTSAIRLPNGYWRKPGSLARVLSVPCRSRTADVSTRRCSRCCPANDGGETAGLSSLCRGIVSGSCRPYDV